MSDLAARIRALANLPITTYGFIYQTPTGDYQITEPDGLTGSVDNRYVISVDQLRIVMRALGITVEQLDAAETLERLTSAVEERRR